MLLLIRLPSASYWMWPRLQVRSLSHLVSHIPAVAVNPVASQIAAVVVGQSLRAECGLLICRVIVDCVNRLRQACASEASTELCQSANLIVVVRQIAESRLTLLVRYRRSGLASAGHSRFYSTTINFTQANR